MDLECSGGVPCELQERTGSFIIEFGVTCCCSREGCCEKTFMYLKTPQGGGKVSSNFIIKERAFHHSHYNAIVQLVNIRCLYIY